MGRTKLADFGSQIEDNEGHVGLIGNGTLRRMLEDFANVSYLVPDCSSGA